MSVSYQTALSHAVQMSLSALTELEAMGQDSSRLGAPPASPSPRRTLSARSADPSAGVAEVDQSETIAELRRQLRQQDTKLRKLSQAHTTTKRKLKEACDRADAAETLVQTARDV